MFNVCHSCGQYRADKTIDSTRPIATCPECGHPHTFRQLPLFVIGGASGTGKSTVCNQLLGQIDAVVVLDADILWSEAFNRPDEQYRSFFEQWLRLCKNIQQSGRSVALFGAGMAVPANLEDCIERRYFSAIHYLALVCDEVVLAQRLQSRPDWRQSSAAAFVAQQLQFNQWLQNYTGQPPIEQIDTTTASLHTTVGAVANWIRKHAGI